VTWFGKEAYTSGGARLSLDEKGGNILNEEERGLQQSIL